MNQASNLIKIFNCNDRDRIGDVIFVHGLGGNAKGTWHLQEKQDDDFWPFWLGEDLQKEGQEVNIWSLKYQVEPFRWKGNTMPLFDRANNCLDVLDSYEIGDRPIVFITHSLGGLLVKQMLCNALQFGTDEWKLILKQTKGIVFLSTPHSGSDLATWIDYIGKILGSSVSVKELQANDSRLRDLNLTYRNNSQLKNIPIKVYCENQKTLGILVVNKTSADPGIPGVIPIPLDCDHISISKLESRDLVSYRNIKKFVKKNLLNSPRQLPPTNSIAISEVSEKKTFGIKSKDN
ncbi:MAG: hypothetical protein QNJ38_14325 [Prochloraceae cyanobacterium]|nr:hypothetical protein [Prochloraceae cyanobacterium]